VLETSVKTFTYNINDSNYVIPFTISNTIGNVAIYISSVAINGTNFSLQENYNNRLICPGETITLQIELEDTTLVTSSGNISITYNDGETKNAELEGAQNTLSTVNYTYYNDLNQVMLDSNFQINKIELFELGSGKLIKSESELNENNYAFSVSYISKGFYVMRVYTTNGVSLKKMSID